MLGALDLRGRDGGELTAVLAQPRRLALLAYLALAPHDFHHRATLLGLFWPEHDEQHGRGALRQALYFLRQTLGPDVVVTRGGEEVRLDPETIWCDVTAFEAEVAAGRLETAIELYRGDLLEGFFISDGPEFERWLDRHRARLAHAYTSTLESQAIHCEERDDHAAAANYWRQLVSRSPENGRAVLRLMQALARTGDRAEALRQAQLHCLWLQREFGALPDPAIPAMVELLRRP